MPVSSVKRRPVPQWSQCEATIKREANWWQSSFRRALDGDDLVQEGWLVAEKVLRYFDPNRGTKVETLLTLALRRHFARLIKTELTRAHLYTEEQREHLKQFYQQTRIVDPRAGALMARLTLMRLRALSTPEQQLALDLLAHGSIRKVARVRRWSIPFTRERVAALRTLLKET